MKIWFAWVVLFVCSISSAFFADEIEQGLQYTFNGKYDTSSRYWQDLFTNHSKFEYRFFDLYNSYIEITDIESYFESENFLSQSNSLLDSIDYMDSANNLSEDRKEFYKAAILTFISGIHSKTGSLFKGYKKIHEAEKIASKILKTNPSDKNLYLIKGTYRYWKDKAIDSIPLIKKSVDKSIEMIAISLNGEKYVRFLAFSQLAWIYYLEKKYEQCLQICNEALKEFPDSRLFLKPKAESYKKMEKYQESIDQYGRVISSLEKDGLTETYINVKLNTKLAELYLLCGNKNKAISVANYVNKLRLDDTNKKASNEYLIRAEKIIRSN